MLAEATEIQSHTTPGFLRSQVSTPALVYDQGVLVELGDLAGHIREQYGVRVLYAVKACAFFDVLQMLAPSLDGFAVSSLFEARLMRDLYPGSPIHLTTPGLSEKEIEELAEICSYVTFNSETQLNIFGPRVQHNASIGLRVNTEISHVRDPRYDPARPHSKLGVPLRSLRQILASAPVEVSGLHFHTNADSENLTELEENVEALAGSVAGAGTFDWLNFGGGYLFGAIPVLSPLGRSVELARRYIANEVFIEPGAGLVRPAGNLIASVVDTFERCDIRVAILDTSVNHLPEVLEFGYQPGVKESTNDGSHEYVLAGGSCLAGDVFGRYRFDAPLELGTTITFEEAGAYAQAKSHRFNGINLPSVWIASPDGSLTARQSPDYKSYVQHWMPDA